MARYILKVNKKKITFAIVVLIITCISFSLIICHLYVWKSPSSQKVFINAQQSVVELKSQTGEDIISYGSAVFIDDSGTLVSNAHMVAYKQSGIYKEFESFEIRFSFENDYREVSLQKYDLNKDISILKLNNITDVNFKAIELGDSTKIASGDKVYAIGNGMNHGLGITQGLISLPQVNIDYEDNIRNVIQCDLIINEGNSGGALLDERGKLIGITTFRLKDNNGNIIYGIAFCIPINVVNEYLHS
ncbi:MAG TPA: trypsin-like peptidase domain-containing protein [Lachnospiraceae bacterium]|nr:trypsin-like peptidase domain-containing protein [Lachnospiraceae bacterium]